MQYFKPSNSSWAIGCLPYPYRQLIVLWLCLGIALDCALASDDLPGGLEASTSEAQPTAETSANPSQPGAETLIEVLLVSLRINQQMMQQPVLVLRAPSGEWWLPTTVLNEARVQLPEGPTRRFNDTDYIAATSLPVESLQFDAATLFMDLRLTPQSFALNRLQTRRSTRIESITRSAGAFLNYDVLLDHGDGGLGRVVFTELGGAIGSGVGLSSQMWVSRPDMDRWVRLDSQYVIDDLDRVTTLKLGDAISRPPPLLGRPVRFAGLQWGTNYRIRPDLITIPVATLSGQAALPSTVDLYVNNVLQSRNPLPPGPFSISTGPMVTGDGEVLLKVTDISGQEQLISQRFYASTSLLASGLNDYSFEFGALRQRYGMVSANYGDLLAAASWRHGLRDDITIEAGGSVQQSGLLGMLGGVSASSPVLGLGSVALGLSHGDAGLGAQIALGWERRTRHHAIALRTQLASHDYRQTGVDAELTLRRLDSMFYSYQLTGIGSLGLSWTQQQRIAAEPLSITTASFSTRQTPWGSLIFSLSRLKSETDTTSFNVFWSYPLGGGTSVSAQHAESTNAPSRQVAQIQKSLPPAEGWGYRLQVAHQSAQQAALYGQNNYGQARLEAAELNGQTRERFGISGAIATLDGQWFLSRRIDSSFGVARVPGFAKVRIYVDNQLAARTNQDGYALLPRLYPYMRNNVTLEALDLPLDTEISQLKLRPVPAWRSGVLIDIPVRKVAAATLNLILDDGTPVPAGAEVDLLDDAGTTIETFAVGREGLVYLSGMRPDNRVLARWPGGACAARIPYQPEPGSIPYLGQYPCQPTPTHERRP